VVRVHDGTASGRLARLAPAAVLALFTAVDLLGGQQVVILGLFAIAPLLAASMLSVRATACYALAALLLALAVGYVDDVYRGERVPGQMFRLSGVAFGGAVAVLACRARQRAEARLARVELVAATVQQALLTQVPSRVGHVEVATSYRSADSDALVGGDLYEVVATPWGVRVLVGDVKGKGLGAVAMAARVLGTFRALGCSRQHGEHVLDDLDGTVERMAEAEDFVTAVLLQIDGDELTVWNAGHPPPLLVRDGVVHRLDPDLPQPPLGLSTRPAPQSHRLAPEDLVLVYTDGLLEARHPRSRAFFPVDDVAGRVLRAGDLSAGLRALGDEVESWAGGLSDDIAMVAVRRSPPGEDRWLRRTTR
jgi:sigma-B regulation protein RsbU (phosphoserine phosphatase)